MFGVYKVSEEGNVGKGGGATLPCVRIGPFKRRANFGIDYKEGSASFQVKKRGENIELCGEGDLGFYEKYTKLFDSAKPPGIVFDVMGSSEIKVFPEKYSFGIRMKCSYKTFRDYMQRICHEVPMIGSLNKQLFAWLERGEKPWEMAK